MMISVCASSTSVRDMLAFLRLPPPPPPAVAAAGTAVGTGTARTSAGGAAADLTCATPEEEALRMMFGLLAELGEEHSDALGKGEDTGVDEEGALALGGEEGGGATDTTLAPPPGLARMPPPPGDEDTGD